MSKDALKNAEGIDKISYDEIEIGNYIYCSYTSQYYVVACLPNIIEKDKHIYALIRLDGQGYYYKSESFEELKQKVKLDEECGELEIYGRIEIV